MTSKSWLFLFLFFLFTPSFAQEKNPVYAQYKGSATLHFKLMHTKLDVSFDWVNKELKGKALLVMAPYAYEQHKVVLDAKNFVLHSVKESADAKTFTDVKTEYNGQKLTVFLSKPYKAGEKLLLQIDYTAQPHLNKGNGSQAITDDKGLYFINPMGTHPTKPRQIWTQGETESSSCWFPTFDYPNVKTTQEIAITVEKGLQTLSNGKKTASVENADGTRTDTWVQEKPHAPYLFMMAVGEFAVVRDEYKNMPVEYYVDKAYEKHARAIFGNTPEMLAFFSKLLDYEFPWDKYAQVVVHDFVSGAMENTSASVFMEQLHIDDRQALSYNWDGIIAHELFHQWFGDLVTCESWANLPLNESFATYSEYLWEEHKYGKHAADFLLLGELKQYLAEANGKRVPPIRYYHDDPDDMFDSHSYARGSVVLHMLRQYLGDKSFFNALSYYLKRNEFGTAEIHDLRAAFEKSAGMDLNWFFNQWFLREGHPELKVKEEYKSGNLKLTIQQHLVNKNADCYQIPLQVDVWLRGKLLHSKQYMVNEINSVIAIEMAEKPDLVCINPDQLLLGRIHYPKKPAQFVKQIEYYGADSTRNYFAVKAALDSLKAQKHYEEYLTSYLLLLQHPSEHVREAVANLFAKESFTQKQEIAKALQGRLAIEKSVNTQAALLAALAPYGDFKELVKPYFQSPSYTVAFDALGAYCAMGGMPDKGLLAPFYAIENEEVLITFAEMLIDYTIKGQSEWMQSVCKSLKSRSSRMYFCALLVRYMSTVADTNYSTVGPMLKAFVEEETYTPYKITIIEAIGEIKDQPLKRSILESLLKTQNEERVRKAINSLL